MADRVKFYTDEHVSKAVVNGLRQRGVDVLPVTEAGMLGASDEEHLAYAKNEERVMFTQDDDFLRLHAAGAAHTGLVYARQQTPTGQVILGLILIHELMTPEDMQGHVEFI